MNVFSLSLLVLSGCSGSGRVHLITQQTVSIDERRALISDFGVGECCWWTEDDGTLKLSLRARPDGMYLGAMALSLELPGLPAGSGREYKLRSKGMRAAYAFREVPAVRLRSFRGVVAVWPQADDRLKVRFRIMAQSQHFTLVIGWRNASTMMVTGECFAVRNEHRGRELFDASEEGNWARPTPTTTTAPATRPAN